MQHPLTLVPTDIRKSLFLALLAWTLILFAVFRVLNDPLVTPVAPDGIVTFDLAGTPEKAFQIIVSWEPSIFNGPDIIRMKAILYAAFGLGLDYLFMPSYALTIALGTLLDAGRHKGRFMRASRTPSIRDVSSTSRSPGRRRSP